MQKIFYYLIIGVITSIATFGQTTGDYRSKTSGNWNSATMWETYDGSNWIDASSAPASGSGVITILSGHTVTVTANVSIDQTTIDQGGEVAINSGVTLSVSSGTGDDLVIDGLVTVFGALHPNNSGSTVIIGSTGIVSCESGGLLNISFGTFQITSGAVVTIKAGGSLSNTSNTAHTLVDAGGTLNIAGSLSITFPSANSWDGNVNVTGTGSISLSSSRNLTMNTGSTLLMEPSTIITGAGSFTLSSGASLKIGSTTGITSSGATGNIQVSGTRSYSTGANYTYNGIAAQVTGNGLPSTVNNLTINGSGGVTLGNSIIVSNILNIIGSLTLPNGTTSTAEYLQFNSTDQSPGDWGSSSSAAGNTNDTYFSNSGTGIISVNGSLPVELTSFSGSVENNVVKLNWLTATEVNNYGFNVERSSSSNSIEWEKIGFVQGHGNSNATKKYSFTDNNIVSGNCNYRLKQIDNDGQFKYSNVIEVSINIPEKFVLEQNYPNPFNPSTSIRYSISKTSIVSLKVYDVLGREVATLVNEEKQPGAYEVNFDASGFSSGIYFYRLRAGGNYSATQKMVLLK